MSKRQPFRFHRNQIRFIAEQKGGPTEAMTFSGLSRRVGSGKRTSR